MNHHIFVIAVFSCGSHSIFWRYTKLKQMTLNCYCQLYGWKQCGNNTIFEEEESLGTSYLTKQPHAHCLYVDYILFWEIWLIGIFWCHPCYLSIYTKENVLCGNSFFWNLGKEENKGMFANWLEYLVTSFTSME
jgi:hypothetical protein